jgi:hypothetical protein
MDILANRFAKIPRNPICPLGPGDFLRYTHYLVRNRNGSPQQVE